MPKPISQYEQLLGIFEGAAQMAESSSNYFNYIFDSIDRTKIDETEYLALVDWQKQLQNSAENVRGMNND